MPTITITEVPDAVYERLEARAKDAGESLSDYLLAELTTLARRPTPEEMRQRLASLEPVKLPESSAETIRQIRAERDRQLMRRDSRGRSRP